MMRPYIPKPVSDVMSRVAAVVSPIYLVGGSVRDILLGDDNPHDYDFTTPVPPDDIEGAVRAAGYKPYLTGKRFGTVGFKLDGRLIEITTFRRETYEPGSRKPAVDFVDNITYDLSRRDFTINAMALREDGRLVDPYDGKGDINRKVIRAVGKPTERFREDPLRMLRAARFSARLGFAIDPETELRAGKKAHHILEVSRERWTSELDGLLMADDPSEGFRFLARTRLLTFMIPELAIQYGFDQDSPYHDLDLFEHTLKTVRLTERDVNMRWAALLHDVGKSFTRTVNKRGYSNYIFHDAVGAEITDRIGRYLKWSNERREVVTRLVRDHLDLASPLHDADTAATKR